MIMSIYKVFSTPFGDKIYNPITNEISNISKMLSNYLMTCNDYSDYSKFDDSLMTEYRILKDKRYFDKSPVQCLVNPITEYIEELLDRNMNQLVLQITQNCNLRCNYCAYTKNDGFQRTHSNKNMNKETAIKSLEFFRKHTIDSKDIRISFYGGEPFINYELMKMLIEESNKFFQGKKLSFNVTTNGTVFNREILSFLEKYQVKLTISLDGNKNVHDANRKYNNSNEGSFEKIKENLFLIQREYPDLFKNLSINMVMDPRFSYDEYKKIFKELPILENTQVIANIVDDSMLNEKIGYSPDFIGPYEYEKFLTVLDILGDRKYNEKLCYTEVMQLWAMLEQALSLETLHNVAIPGGPCIPGYKKIFVDINGDLFPCEKVRETSDCMKIGNIETGIDYTMIKNQLNVQLLTEYDCLECWAFRLCDSCILFSDGGKYLSPKKRLSYCKQSKCNALYKLQYFVAYQELSKRKEGI